MIPLLAPSAGTVAIGAGAKGTMLTKPGILSVGFAALSPFLGIAAGIVSHWLIIRDSTADRRMRLQKIGVVIAAWVFYLALATGGEAGLYALADYLEWSEQSRFSAAAIFWWSFVTATLTLQIVVIRRMQMHRMLEAKPDGSLRKSASQMKPMTFLAVAMGAHAAMFGWLIAFAWNSGDAMGTIITTGTMIALTIRAFARFRTTAIASLAQPIAGHVTLACTLILIIINLRADVWVALRYAISPAQALILLPLEIIPLLTLVLVCWVGLVLGVTANRKQDLGPTSG